MGVLFGTCASVNSTLSAPPPQLRHPALSRVAYFLGPHMDKNRLESLPLELLEKAIEQLPVLDILRVGQVGNRIGIHLVRGSAKVQINR